MKTPHTDGVVLVDKPPGPTSFDIVAMARRAFGQRSVGHAGTLDPMATGVLVVLLGEATKLSSYLTLADKQYQATVRFGVSTDTHDAEGTVTARCDAVVTPQQLEQALKRERERTEQIPPERSAIKVAGRRAHALHRAGEPVILPPRPVTLKSVSALQLAADLYRFELTVSKGYYVRAFARDLGEFLGTGAHLASLRRRRSGCFAEEEAHWPLDKSAHVLPLSEAARRALPCAELTDDGVLAAAQGHRLPTEYFAPGLAPRSTDPTACFGRHGDLVALSRPVPDTPETHRVLRGFAGGQEALRRHRRRLDEVSGLSGDELAETSSGESLVAADSDHCKPQA